MYLEKLKLDGQVAVVTGAGQGIGAACARALGEAGAKVIVADFMPDRIDATVAAQSRALEGFPPQASSYADQDCGVQ